MYLSNGFILQGGSSDTLQKPAIMQAHSLIVARIRDALFFRRPAAASNRQPAAHQILPVNAQAPFAQGITRLLVATIPQRCVFSPCSNDRLTRS